MDNTPNTQLPFIAPAQAQKHVTHNEALKVLDALVQLSAVSRGDDPLAFSPINRQRFLVENNPVGLWSGQANNVAAWQDGAWQFYAPKEGWLCWIQSEESLLVYSNGTWVAFDGEDGTLSETTLLGVNATASTTQRFAVSSDTSLLNHAGSDHRLLINKSSGSSVASLLFQNDFSARAEIGLVGDDALSLKVTPDGTSWLDAIRIDPSTGYAGLGIEPQSRLDIGGDAGDGWPVRIRGDDGTP